MKKPRYTKEQKDSFIIAYQDDWRSCASVAKKLGIPPNSLQYILKTNKIAIKQRSHDDNREVNAFAFDKIDNEVSAYWLGFLYADGNVSNSMITVILNPKDREHLQKLNDFLSSEYEIRSYPRRRNDREYPQACLHINNKYLASSLTDKGIVKNRTRLDLLLSSVEPMLYPHLVRGIFDGDGCAATRPRMIFCGQEELMVWIREAILESTSIKKRQKIIPHISGSIFYLTYYGKNIHIVSEWMYHNASVWLERKKSIIDSY